MIHDIVFHGNGGFDYYSIYNMPIWLRKFTFQQIQENFDEQSKQQNKTMSKGEKSMVNSEGKVNVPDFKKASEPYKGKTSYK